MEKHYPYLDTTNNAPLTTKEAVCSVLGEVTLYETRNCYRKLRERGYNGSFMDMWALGEKEVVKKRNILKIQEVVNALKRLC